MGYNSVSDNMGLSSFLAVIAYETREMSRNSNRICLTAVQGHPWSPILVSMESLYVCDFLLVINCNFSRICYRFRDIEAYR